MATNTVPYDYGLGRRKSATARARLTVGKGKVTINGKSASDYLSDNKTLLAEITDPLALVGKQKEFDVSVLVKGGGEVAYGKAEQIIKSADESRRKMQKAAAELDFSAASKYRDEMWALQEYLKVWKEN